MSRDIQVGHYVRFRVGKAPEALKGREDAVGAVVAFVQQVGPEPWPIVQFAGYVTPALQPGLVEIVGGPERVVELPGGGFIRPDRFVSSSLEGVTFSTDDTPEGRALRKELRAEGHLPSRDDPEMAN